MTDVLQKMINKVMTDPEHRFKSDEIEFWAGSLGNWEFYNELSLHIAMKYHAGELNYSTCDGFMNDLWSAVTDGLIADKTRAVPEPFYSIFLAFDEGEYYHKKDRSDDPVADYTDPMIAELLREHFSTLGKQERTGDHHVENT